MLRRILLLCWITGIAGVFPLAFDTGTAQAALAIEGYTLVVADAGDTGSDNTVVIPANATFVVAFWNHWDGNARGLTSLTIDGQAFTIHENQLSTAGGIPAAGVATRDGGFTTGSGKTISWDWNGISGACDNGCNFYVIYVSGEAATPVSDTAVAGTTGTTNPGPLALTVTASTDLVLGMAINSDTSSPGAGTDQTILNSWDNHANGANLTDIFRETTTDSPTTNLEMTNPNYAAMAGIAIAEAAGGGGGSSLPKIHQQHAANDDTFEALLTVNAR